jgi:hypothetical protein
MSAMSECIERFTLIQRRFEYLPSKEASEVDAHIAGCAECQARLAALDETMEARGKDPESLLTGVREHYSSLRTRTRIGRRQSYWLPLGVATAVVILCTVAVKVLDDEEPMPKTSAMSGKPPTGELACNIFVKRNGEQLHLKNGDSVRPGDELLFVIYTGGPGYLVAISVNANGRIQNLVPATDSTIPFQIEKTGTLTLPRSPPLDDLPGEETVAVFFSPKPMALKTLQGRLATLDTKTASDELQLEAKRISGSAKLFRFSKLVQ